MRLYTMHKREFVLVYLTFLGALGLSLLIGLAGPAMTLTAKQSATQLTTTTQQLNKTSSTPQKLNDNNVSLFQLKTPPLSRYSQQLWLIAEVLVDVGDAGDLRMKQTTDPLFTPGIDDLKGVKGVLFAVCGCVYVFYLLYLVFKAYGELHSLPYFDLRLKFLTSMTAIAVTVATVVSIAAPYPPIGYLSHLSIDLSPYNSSLPFTLTYTVINIYLFTIAYVYRPSERALMETHIKDNPALSMVNDSDEDIYTQDDDFVDNDFNTQDDFRQPLNRPARE
ncbi:hypothetical protein Pmani_018922 [Petrolisthes manimaculis]|uniref:Wntless-like transmembrane domain-containing protein n=1 Tax=Petrolisthes manimaculis TaxID=1843537 RepID=A0AAE1U7X7_9EUCA|nr:hypothetical protein Pmani_018922 [Petrolisthes manimaculis]